MGGVIKDPGVVAAERVLEKVQDLEHVIENLLGFLGVVPCGGCGTIFEPGTSGLILTAIQAPVCLTCLPDVYGALSDDELQQSKPEVARYLAELEAPDEYKAMLHEHPDLEKLIQEEKQKHGGESD